MYKEKEEQFSQALFDNPTAEYRGTPFWAWNCQMTKENIDQMVEALQTMGMGGAHIHCRTGLTNPYLGEEFQGLVKYTNEQFKKRNMLTWLYDEDRWPSGAGGGYVTKDHAYRIRFLVFSPTEMEEDEIKSGGFSSSGQAVRSSERILLARYGVTLGNKYLSSYRVLKEQDEAEEGEDLWFAYLEVSGDNPWFNNQAYLNTLDKKAVERFMEVTHETYRKLLGDEFGRSVPAIFTDEPQFSHKDRFEFAEDRKEITIPFTDDLERTFTEAYGHSLLEHLPELFWELPKEQVSLIRYEYHDHIAERFAEAFADTIGQWCSKNAIMLTGHMMEEPTLQSQTAALGEAMRSYRSFHLPGIDMLCDWVELSTAKQAQSASRQFGCPGVLSELYGVTNWDFDFKGHKLQGDWQAALGITVRVPHLTWTSMAGEAKRDYPASIGFQSPWHHEYSYIENYFSRINTIMTRGKASVRIGVIHPIESYWMHWGTEEQTGAVRREQDDNFDRLISWLLYGLQDFDFLCESLLPELTKNKEMKDGKLSVGDMQYDVVLVPDCLTLRSSTIDLLEEFLSAGGRVIMAGHPAAYEGAKPSGRPGDMAEKCTKITFDRKSILQELEAYRFLDIRNADGNRTDNLIYQLREEADRKWLFISHVQKMKNRDLPEAEHLTITINGKYKVTRYDALTGKKYGIAAEARGEETLFYYKMYEQDSLLLSLEDKRETTDVYLDREKYFKENRLGMGRITAQQLADVELEEPNVLVLDQAEYQFDGGGWNPKEEILRIDNQFRGLLGYPMRMEAFAQPWTQPDEEKPEHMLHLRFNIASETEVQEVILGIEEAQTAVISLNGQAARVTKDWYVDPCIQQVLLGKLKQGDNELLVDIPYHSKCNVEAMYLLGDFGVRVCGSGAVVTKPVKQLAFGDIVSQGLPFYGGNLTYCIPFQIAETGEYELTVSKFRAPLLQIWADGEKKGNLAFSPYRISLGTLEKGTHMLDIKLFGSRINTFGTLHNCNQNTEWYGPNAWRTDGDSWAYEYQLRRCGILKAPETARIINKNIDL